MSSLEDLIASVFGGANPMYPSDANAFDASQQIDPLPTTIDPRLLQLCPQQQAPIQPCDGLTKVQVDDFNPSVFAFENDTLYVL